MGHPRPQRLQEDSGNVEVPLPPWSLSHLQMRLGGAPTPESLQAALPVPPCCGTVWHSW